MKSRNSIFFSLLPLLFSASAIAQSSVTLYGIIDAGLTYASNVGGNRLYQFGDGVNLGNRFGLKGKEDLGGGYSAMFTLENGFTLGNGGLAFGNGTRIFGRQAYVGIGTPLFSVKLGSQYDFIFDYISEFSPGGYASGYAAHAGNLDRQAGARLDNAIKIESVEYRGLKFGGMYSFGNVAGDFHRGSGWSLGTHYSGSNFSAAATYTQLNNPSGINGFYPYAQLGIFSFLGQQVATRTGDSVTDLYPAGMSIDRQAIWELGAAYKLGKLTFSGNITATTLKGHGNQQTLQVYELGALYYATPTILAIVGYDYERLTGSGVHWNQPAVGVFYFLSKNTSLLLAAAYQRASGNAVANQGSAWYFGPSSNHEQTTVRIGIEHFF
ncbi:TPA: porin [Burkholderia cenocepacia]|nr:porin [Burkholderia cenocepacia]